MTTKFPVLDLGIRPRFDPISWTLRVHGEAQNAIELSWRDFTALPYCERTSDFHCVTSWSKFDVEWGGVGIESIIDAVRPTAKAKFCVQRGADGYSTSLPLSDMLAGGCLLAYTLAGEPLPPEHGAPVRLIFPRRYAYKGAKFLSELLFTAEERFGHWERRGYNNHADPWQEERFSSNSIPPGYYDPIEGLD